MLEFESYGLKSGYWSGVLTGDVDPKRVYLALYGKILAYADFVASGVNQWDLSVALPSEVLSDGIQTLLLVADNGEKGDVAQADAYPLAHLNLMAGAVLDGDLIADVEMLRAEVEMLKREFRRLASFD